MHIIMHEKEEVPQCQNFSMAVCVCEHACEQAEQV